MISTSSIARRPRRRPTTSSAFGHDPWWLILLKTVLIFVILVLLTLFNIWWERRVVARMQHRIGPNVQRPLRPAPVARRRREAGAEGGHHPEGRRQGGLPPRAGDRGRPGVRDLRGDPVRAGGDDPVHRQHDPAAADRHAGRGALRDGDRLDRHLRHRARRLVQRLDVLPARRPALERADDLLRGRDGPRARRGVPLRRLDVDLGDRRGAGQVLVRR